MKRILLAMDALNFSVNTVDFAAYIAKLTKAEMVGLFLRNPVYETVDFEGKVLMPYPEDSEQILQKNIQKFKDSCISREVNAAVHAEVGIPLDEIIKESRYADLIVTDASISFEPTSSIPSVFLKDLLMRSECPVAIAPESFDSIDTLIFTYHSDKSCLFAIKHFTYLFPQFSNKKVIVLNVVHDFELSSVEQENINNWLKLYYSNVEFTHLRGGTRTELLKYFFDTTNALVVMGSFGRSSLSYLFQPSKAELLIKTINLPFFITHF